MKRTFTELSNAELLKERRWRLDIQSGAKRLSSETTFETEVRELQELDEEIEWRAKRGGFAELESAISAKEPTK